MTVRAIDGVQSLMTGDTSWASWKSYLLCCFSASRSNSSKSTKYRSNDVREAPIGGPDTEDSDDEKNPDNLPGFTQTNDQQKTEIFDRTDNTRQSAQSDYGSGISCERDDDVIDESRDPANNSCYSNELNLSIKQEDDVIVGEDGSQKSYPNISDLKNVPDRCSVSSAGSRNNSLKNRDSKLSVRQDSKHSVSQDSYGLESSQETKQNDCSQDAVTSRHSNLSTAQAEKLPTGGQTGPESQRQSSLPGDNEETSDVVNRQGSINEEEIPPTVRSQTSDTNLPSQRQSDPEEQLFDVSDLRDRDVISKCGRLLITLEYKSSKTRLSVTIHNAEDLPSPERVGATNGFQVHLVLVPKKNTRQKTKVKAGDSPAFDEKFQFKVAQVLQYQWVSKHQQTFDDLVRIGLRVRLYGCLRSRRREVMIGEYIVPLGGVVPDQPGVAQWLTLEPRNNLTGTDSQSERSSIKSRSRSHSATSSIGEGSNIEGRVSQSNSANDRDIWGPGSAPELLLGIFYNSTTGRLTVEVIKGSGLQLPTMTKPPDTFVSLALMSRNRTEMARGKTSVRRHQPHPVFRETFMFQVPQSQLANVSLHVSVFSKKSLKREEMIGWVTLGEVNSSEEEKVHWDDVTSGNNVQTDRWHQLLEP